MPRSAVMLVEEFGPKMQALTAQEQMFVCLLFAGYVGVTKVAEAAGYEAETRNALRVKAHRLIHRIDIGEAVIEESKRRTTFLMPKAQHALENMVENAQHQDHFKAVKMVREESGVSAVQKSILDVNVNFNQLGQKEKVEHIIAFAEKRGIDPKTLLGFDPGKVVDAEFTETIPRIEDDPDLMALA